MPPRLLPVVLRQSRVSRLANLSNAQQICPICSISQALRPAPKQRRARPSQHQQQAKLSSSSIHKENAPVSPRNTRAELREALVDLRKDAANYINISRLQLALRGLEQPLGKETIRIAIRGLGDSETSTRITTGMIKLLLADPLSAEAEWERIINDHNLHSKPLLLKVGHDGPDTALQTNRLVEEVYISSPTLNEHNLEILILQVDAPMHEAAIDRQSFEDYLLVPTMEIPTSGTGRYTPVTTPVHKTLLVGDGVIGATRLLHLPIGSNTVGAALNIQFIDASTREQFPLIKIFDLQKANAALESFRKDVEIGPTFGNDWLDSGMPGLSDWLEAGTAPTHEVMKTPLRNLIEAVLRSATTEVENEEMKQLASALTVKISAAKLVGLQGGLAEWAERAHTELRDSLDIAFNGRRWQKLGWWKLFWRVDDVSMIASDILNQRFLPDAEREVIYLAGVIDEAFSKDTPVTFEKDWAYKPVAEMEETGILKHAPPPKIQDLIERRDDSPSKIKAQPWPLEIPTTRALLAADTVPALQALAQKLVLQTLTTSTFSTAFAGLIYVSTLSTSLYEAGAVAAVGIVWSLRRMQGQWETARKFWEGEVREEGRKAVRGVESVFTNVLVPQDRPLERAEEFKRAREALQKALNALEQCK